jgi:hypothetical protein
MIITRKQKTGNGEMYGKNPLLQLTQLQQGRAFIRGRGSFIKPLYDILLRYAVFKPIDCAFPFAGIGVDFHHRLGEFFIIQRSRIFQLPEVPDGKISSNQAEDNKQNQEPDGPFFCLK